MNLKQFEKMKKEMAKLYLEVAEWYAKSLEFDKAKEFIDKAVQLIEGNNEGECIICKVSKANNLIQIIRELKKVIK